MVNERVDLGVENAATLFEVAWVSKADGNDQWPFHTDKILDQAPEESRRIVLARYPLLCRRVPFCRINNSLF